jgi:hypothetical protein
MTVLPSAIHGETVVKYKRSKFKGDSQSTELQTSAARGQESTPHGLPFGGLFFFFPRFSLIGGGQAFLDMMSS